MAGQRKRPGSRIARTESAMDAVERMISGEPLADVDVDAIAWLQKFLRLDKPIQSYSKRTRQRYASGAKRGLRAADIRAEERTKRASREDPDHPGFTGTQWNTIQNLVARIEFYHVDVAPYFDDDVLEDIVQTYGYDYLRTVLTEQLDSTIHYTRSNSDPGKMRWEARGTLEQRFAASGLMQIYFGGGTDPYYYYHGIKP